MIRRRVLIFLVLVLAGLGIVEGADKVSGTVIFDLTGKNNQGPSAYFFCDRSFGDIAKVLGVDFATENGEGNKNVLFLEKLKKKYKRGTDHRWVSESQAALEVVVFYKPPKEGEAKTEPKITFDEKSRQTVMMGDMGKLVKLAVSLGTRGGTAQEVLVARGSYVLGLRRGVLTVSASWNDISSNIILTTGPTEHWFLTADLPVAKLSQVKFVQDGGGTIEPRETPKHFYLGVNGMIGDILKEKPRLLQNFFIKGMLKISKTPLDGYGVGVGYRFPKMRPLGVDISSFSIFAAVLWTKEENEDKTAKVTKRQIMFGIGYNLDKAKK